MKIKMKGRKPRTIENSRMVFGRTRKRGKEDEVKEPNFQLSMISKIQRAKVKYGNTETALC